MRQAIFLLIGFFVASPLWGQSTISERPLELTLSNGLWGTMLPAYELGTSDSGGSAIRDNLNDVGYIGDLRLVRRFLGTRTSFETRGFFAYAESTAKSGSSDVDIPNPVTGANFPGTGEQSRLKSKVSHYGWDVALRDTWRTRWGGLSGGCGFSYMRFDRKFDVDYGSTDLLAEKLNSKFVGGKAFVGWDGCIRSCPTNIDLGVGFYGMYTDYVFNGQAIPGSLYDEVYQNTTTLETSFTTFKDFRGYRFGFHFGVVYFEDLPVIRHKVGSPATVGYDDACTLNGSIQILL